MSGQRFRQTFGDIEYILDFTTNDLDSFEAERRCATFSQEGLESNTAILAPIKSFEENNNVITFIDSIQAEFAFEPRFVWLGLRTNINRVPPLATDYFYLDGDLDQSFYDDNNLPPWGIAQPSSFNSLSQPCVAFSRGQAAGRNVWNDSFCNQNEGFPLCQINLLELPTTQPTQNPTKNPTRNPTKQPSQNPSKTPTSSPTEVPSENPTIFVLPVPTLSPEPITLAPAQNLDEDIGNVGGVNGGFLAVGISMILLFFLLGAFFSFQRRKLHHLTGKSSQLDFDTDRVSANDSYIY